MDEKMNIIITGANGQLGQSLRKVNNQFPDIELIETDLEELDITDLNAVKDFISNNPSSALVNCAGYTAVDKAEDQPEMAFLINETATANLATACKEAGMLFVHISTDYVFSGKSFRPYHPDSPIKPESVYGKSKAAGEKMMQKINPAGYLIRTSWLYSEFGQNFVKTMLKLGAERADLNVIADQIGSPTYASDLAIAILQMLSKSFNDEKPAEGLKVYHFSNTGCASWFDLTKAIMELNNLSCRIHPIPTESYPLPAKRPFYSILSTDQLVSDFGIEIPYWRSSLKDCIDIINQLK